MVEHEESSPESSALFSLLSLRIAVPVKFESVKRNLAEGSRIYHI